MGSAHLGSLEEETGITWGDIGFRDTIFLSSGLGIRIWVQGFLGLREWDLGLGFGASVSIQGIGI